MDRRNFVKASSMAGLGTLASADKIVAKDISSNEPFNLKYAPHFGMFKNHAPDLLDQIRFAYDMGFRAWEDNGMKGRDVALQESIGNLMAEKGMEMGVFVAHEISWREPNLVNGDKDKLASFLKDIEGCIEVAKRTNAKWMTVVPGHMDLSLEHDYQMAYLIDALRMACDILEPHGLTMVLEPLNHWSGHAGQFLAKIPQAYLLCRAVNSSSCKILFDIYHQQIQEGNIIPNIDYSWSEIGYFQIGDNPGRKEPTTGEINYLKIFDHISTKSKDLVMGMEHGNSLPGKEGEMAVIEAYRASDAF